MAKTFNDSVTHIIVVRPYAGLSDVAQRLGIKSATDVSKDVHIIEYNEWIQNTVKACIYTLPYPSATILTGSSQDRKEKRIPTEFHLISWDMAGARWHSADAGTRVRKPYVPSKRRRTE